MKFSKRVAGITAAGLVLLVLLVGGQKITRNATANVIIRNTSRDKNIILPIPANRTVEVGFIHSLYGGRQAESFLIGPDRILNLQQVKFEVYDALLYYTGGGHAREWRADGFWLIPSDYRTDSINYVLPQRQRNFFVRIGEQLYAAESLGEPADIIRIYVAEEP